MKKWIGLSLLLILGLLATAARAEPAKHEPPASGPKLGAKIVPLKRGQVSERGRVSGKICWSCFG